LYDVAPPENDAQAHEMASRIRTWIRDGRPKPGEKKEQQADKTTEPEEKVKEDKKEKSKKGLFGWLKK
jgi:fused signal recognition particle receptor